MRIANAEYNLVLVAPSEHFGNRESKSRASSAFALNHNYFLHF